MTALTAYRDLLLRWNQRVNLTGPATGAVIDEHIADCLHLVSHLPSSGSLVDVGSGGGLPAVVIAIERPALQVTALEPTHKKHAFLRTVARELSLPNLEPLAVRWEDHSRGGYDVATSRGTLEIGRWLEVGSALVRPGGMVMGMEGRDQIELPPGVRRVPYELSGKTRAILIKQLNSN